MSAKNISLPRKVPDGKFFSLDVIIDNGIIIEAHIRGDFFLFPEHTITALESCLKGKHANAHELEKKIEAVLSSHKAELVGISAKDIAEVAMEALA